jgi:hypothetical protein
MYRSRSLRVESINKPAFKPSNGVNPMAPRICDGVGLVLCVGLLLNSGQGFSDFLPIQADFHLKKTPHLASPPIMDNVAFESLIQKTFEPFTQHAATNGAKITYEVYWNSSSAGAFTLRKDQGCGS